MLLSRHGYRTIEEAIQRSEEFVSEMGIEKFRAHVKMAYEKYKTEIEKFTNPIKPKVTNVMEI